MSSPVWHPFTQHGLGMEMPIAARAEGAAIFTQCGRRIVDGISSWWVTTHGHCHPRIMAAIARQTETLDQVIFANFTHEPAERLARGLLEMLPPGLGHVFYSDSGSTAVEVALKMALGYWANIDRPRHRIVVMEGSYHGDTIGGMSVGERGPYNAAYGALLFDVARIPFPAAGHEQATLDALEAICRTEAPAALIVEPLVLGAGGMQIYGADTLRAMREICARHEVLFIADEVMTGWGRTGTAFACEQAGISPDIVAVSKGLTGGAIPLAATAATPAIFEAHRSEDRGRMFFHSSSYTANPIACAAALANLDIWCDEPVLERVATLGAAQDERLAQVAMMPGVANPRRAGTIAAFDIEMGERGYLASQWPEMMRHFLDRDMLLRPLGNTLYAMPPYCIDEADLDRLWAALAEAVERFRAR